MAKCFDWYVKCFYKPLQQSESFQAITSSSVSRTLNKGTGTKVMRTLSIKVKLVSDSMNHLETWNRIKSTMFALNSTVSLLNVNIRLSLRLSLSLVFCSQILMTSTPRPPNKIFNLLIRSNPPQISAIAGILSALGQLKGDCTFQTRLFFPITVWVGIQDGSQANRLSVSENSSTTWWWI